MKPIYLDHNATTPVDPAVLDAMLPFLREEFGNPSSAHVLGRRARNAVEQARTEVAALIGARSDEIVFTGGGTEASNIAIRGSLAGGRGAIVTSAIEHPATEECCTLLEREGHAVRRVSPKPCGRLDAQAVIDAIDDGVALVTLIHAQNEIGTLQPIAEIAPAARNHGALVHADAAQSLGKVPIRVDALGVDLLSIAGHKLYAPKGVGALFVRHGIELQPIVVGASQEHGRRPGTENVAFIVGLGAACRIAAERLVIDRARISECTVDLAARLRRAVPGLTIVGEEVERLPNTLNVLFPSVSGRRLLERCPQVLASTGSACHADREEPSAILTALGINAETALGAVRLSLGRSTTAADIEQAVVHLTEAWHSLRFTEPAIAHTPSESLP
jgi:cysteine desulfurase